MVDSDLRSILKDRGEARRDDRGVAKSNFCILPSSFYLLLLRLRGLLLRQVIQFPGQALDLLALLPLHPFKTLLQLPQLPLQLFDFICGLRPNRRPPGEDDDGKNRDSGCEVAARTSARD